MDYNENTLFRVVNKDDKPFVSMYNNVKYRIEPNSETVAQFGAIDCWFGNPLYVDKSDTDRKRWEAWQHLMAKYGAIGDMGKWEENKPKVEVYSMEGERVWTIVDDPHGEHVTPAATQTSHENKLLQQSIEQLQAQLAAQQALLSEMVHRKQDQSETELTTVEIDADTPTIPAIMPNTIEVDGPK